MKHKNLLALLTVMLLVSGCSSQGTNTSTTPSVTPSVTPPSVEPPKVDPPADTGPKKVIVPAHTLKDSNLPINPKAKGERVDEDTWNTFKYMSQSAFKGHYNFTYRAYAGMLTIQAFTKNGYFMQSGNTKKYYERKSGSTFYVYNYNSQEGSYLRTEETFDLEETYTYRIHHEVYVHYDNYEDYDYFDEDDGVYWYSTTSFAKTAKFQGGYLTGIHFGMTGIFYDIEKAFETTIDIPESYYYE